MFGKKKLLARIEVLENRIRRLENMHATILPKDNWEMPSYIHRGSNWEDKYGRVGYYNGRQLNSAEVELQPIHPQPKQVDYRRITNVPATVANTENINGVTMEELARYVLDGTPIERKTKEEVVYQTSYSPNETSEFVETKLGNISVIERTDYDGRSCW